MSVISRILKLYKNTDQFKSPGHPHKTSTELRKDSQWGIGSILQLELLTGSVLNRAKICLGTPLISNNENKKARFAFVEEHVVWTEENRCT